MAGGLKVFHGQAKVGALGDRDDVVNLGGGLVHMAMRLYFTEWIAPQLYFPQLLPSTVVAALLSAAARRLKDAAAGKATAA